MPGYRTYDEFEKSIWAEEVFPEFEMGVGTYRFYRDVQNIFSITLQLAPTEPLDNAEITAIRIVPVGKEIFDLGRTYMCNLICDFIYGNGAYKNDTIIDVFRAQIAAQNLQYEVEGEGVYQVRFFALEHDVDKAGLHCDSSKAYDWVVPRAEEFLIDDSK